MQLLNRANTLTVMTDIKNEEAGEKKSLNFIEQAVDMLEPGSTFKTASIMVALEDGKITPDYVVDTGNGQMRRIRSI